MLDFDQLPSKEEELRNVRAEAPSSKPMACLTVSVIDDSSVDILSAKWRLDSWKLVAVVKEHRPLI